MNRRNQPRRGALVLAPLVLAAIVTGVAASATNTVVPSQLTGRWALPYSGTVMVVGPRGKVNIHHERWYHAKFLRVTEHGLAPLGRLSISGGPRSCSGTGTYGWKTWYGLSGGSFLHFTTIHDACKPRVDLLGSHWRTLPWRHKP
jgi:hypothetical protein